MPWIKSAQSGYLWQGDGEPDWSTYPEGNVVVNYDVRGTGANWNLTFKEKQKLFDEMKSKGRLLTNDELAALHLLSNENANKEGKARFENLQQAMKMFADNNKAILGFDSIGNTYSPEGVQISASNLIDPKTSAFNDYYNDLYSLKEGTGGANLRDNLGRVYENQAQSALSLADANYQSEAFRQAQTVKQITDQVRAERMSRLRAGMSESQIANQDMQMLMANVNSLNENATMLGQQRLEARVGKNTAQDEAYLAYLDQVNARGQNAAAFYAADSGNANWATIQNMRTKYGTDASKWTTEAYTKEQKLTTGQPAGN